MRAFPIEADEARVDNAERPEVQMAAEVPAGTDSRHLLAPDHVLVRLPYVGTAASETGGPEAHRLPGDVAGEGHQAGAGELLPPLPPDREEQAVRRAALSVGCRFGQRHETDPRRPGGRRVGEHFCDRLVLRGPVGAQVDLRLRRLGSRGDEART